MDKQRRIAPEGILHKTLFGIFIVLIVIIISFTVIKCNYPSFDFITYISTVSSFFIAILTVLYVLTTSRQLGIMKLQLKQMEKESRFKNEPLPVLEKCILRLENPRFFYAPPFDEYSFFSRYFLHGDIYNLTEEPVICLVVKTKILVKGEDNSTSELLAFEKNIEFLAGKEKTLNEAVSSMIVQDKKGILFEAIRERKEIICEIKLFYKNISGGCFIQKNCKQMIAEPEHIEVIKQWHTYIAMFFTKYKEELKILKSIKNKDREQWESIFSKIKKDIQEEIPSHPIQMELYSMPDEFEIKTIEEKDFLIELEKDDYRKSLFEKMKKQ